MAQPRILLYTLRDYLPLAHDYLQRRGLEGAIQLQTTLHEQGQTPSAEDLAGFDAVMGEYMPIPAHAAGRFAQAGVKLVASMSIGVNHLAIAELAAGGTLVANCPGYCADEVATHTLALMLDLNRKVTYTNTLVKQGIFDPKSGRPMRRLSGQTLGLVFFGTIAQKVVQMVSGLGLNVLVWAPTKTAEAIASAGATKVETLDELLAASDILSLHCPLIDATHRLLGAREFALMKPGALLINTARGAVIDEDALLDALDSGQIAGAGLDVLEHEATNPNPALIAHPHVVVTPHSAFDSLETERALVEMCLNSCIELLLQGKVPTHVVDA